nr:stromal cell-derived factor 2-like protein 1 [Loxodonta africana]
MAVRKERRAVQRLAAKRRRCQRGIGRGPDGSGRSQAAAAWRTHHFASPLSNNQEVSAFGEDGEGDDLDLWTVRCSGQHWEREASVRFQHVGTSVFLSVTGEQYGSPIRGQQEVHGMTSANAHNTWKAMEGIFIKPSAEPSTGHDEL